MARLVGGWRIAEMDLWDRDVIDLLGPAFIEFTADGTGSFRFIAVEGNLDFRHDERAAGARLEFTWEGDDDGSQVSGVRSRLGRARARRVTLWPHLLPPR